MSQDTREQFLISAEALFAERGFYGVSIAAIADQLGLTKQALLHHFGSKEKLYGEVLQRISQRFDEITPEPDAGGSTDPETVFRNFFAQLYASDRGHPEQTRLLLRELLDNRGRAGTAETWYLRPFLNRLIGLLKATPAWTEASDADALAAVYQLLGAMIYFSVSQPTLTGIFGEDAYGELDAVFPSSFERLVTSVLGK